MANLSGALQYLKTILRRRKKKFTAKPRKIILEVKIYDIDGILATRNAMAIKGNSDWIRRIVIDLPEDTEFDIKNEVLRIIKQMPSWHPDQSNAILTHPDVIRIGLEKIQ
jgi:hypothetical protein